MMNETITIIRIFEENDRTLQRLKMSTHQYRICNINFQFHFIMCMLLKVRYMHSKNYPKYAITKSKEISKRTTIVDPITDLGLF